MNLWILRANILVIVIHLAIVGFAFLDSEAAYNVGMSMMLLANVSIALFSVCRIQRLIRGLRHAFPNERFIDAHYVTFVCYAIAFLSAVTLTLLSGIGFSISSANEYSDQSDLHSLKL